MHTRTLAPAAGSPTAAVVSCSTPRQSSSRRPPVGPEPIFTLMLELEPGTWHDCSGSREQPSGSGSDDACTGGAGFFSVFPGDSCVGNRSSSPLTVSVKAPFDGRM